MRTAIYSRVSTRAQEDNTSLKEQERASREKAAGLGWDVSEAHVYHEVSSGGDLFRPQMERLWDAMTAHEIDAVIFDVLDRLGRDEGDLGALYHHAAKYGVTVELASESIDESEQGRSLRTLMGIVARMERADILRRTQGGRRVRATLGRLFPGATPLYGYLWDDPQKKARYAYIVDPETAPVVVRIHERIADGIAIRALCRELDAQGVPTPAQVLAARGQLPRVRNEAGELVERDAAEVAAMTWQPGMIGHILHHPAYAGRHSAYRYASERVNEVSTETGVAHKVTRTRERAMDDPARVAFSEQVCPPLITPELAARVHAQLAANKENSARHNPDPLATLWRGMAYCGHCGSTMGTLKVSKPASDEQERARRYRCSSMQVPGRERCPGGKHTIGAAQLDPAAWADVVDWLRDEKNVARLFAEWAQQEQSTQGSIASRLDAVNAQLAHLRERMSALVDTISETSNRESRAVLQEKLDALGEQVTRENSKREQLLRDARASRDRARDERDMCVWAHEVAERAGEFTREQQRDTLQALGAQVTIWCADYQHPDGWPQRYKVTLSWTGFSGHPVTLPAHSVNEMDMLLPLPSGNA